MKIEGFPFTGLCRGIYGLQDKDYKDITQTLENQTEEWNYHGAEILYGFMSSVTQGPDELPIS